MLGEIAITPDVFIDETYSGPVAAALVFERLREPLLHEVLVRNLFDGDWYRAVMNSVGVLSPRAKELLKKLRSQQRLRNAPACAPSCPQDDQEWFQEALSSSNSDPLDCIVTTGSTKQYFAAERIAVSAEKLCSHAWWSGRSSSVRLSRTTDDYVDTLERVLSSANSVMFIDPYLDPSKHNYREFFQLLRLCHRTCVPLLIEIHRVCYESSGPGRKILSSDEWQERFESSLRPALTGTSLQIEVFVWDEFHDRYLISNLVGISVPNGFDIGQRVGNQTTWTRLGRDDRDDIQREFDPSCPRHVIRHRFTLTF